MEYWPVTVNKFVGYVRKGSDDIVVQPTRHHVWIYDRSGSMGWVIAQLAEDVCLHLDEIPAGDFVSVGWFSSPGEFRWFVKGAKLTSKSSYDDVKKVVRANATSL